MRTLPTIRDMLRANRSLPDDLKQSCVLLAFVIPIEHYHASEFLNIRLTRMMLAGGECDYYMSHRAQPDRIGDQQCVWCFEKMERTGAERFTCRTAGCMMIDKTGAAFAPAYAVDQWHGPTRGVVQTFVDPRFITHTVIRDGRPLDFTDRILLMLDRRYREEILCAIYRTAGQICDEKGWMIR